MRCSTRPAAASSFSARPRFGVDQMVEWIAAWVARGGRSLGKPTHYEERKGAF